MQQVLCLIQFALLRQRAAQNEHGAAIAFQIARLAEPGLQSCAGQRFGFDETALVGESPRQHTLQVQRQKIVRSEFPSRR